MKNSGTTFKAHGSYTVSNTGGYLIEISNCGDAARLQLPDSTITDWLEIECLANEDNNGEPELYIDPNGYNIPLLGVMRLN